MNVFILNTGRCGSLTFIRACSHIRNFTSGHESRSGLPGPERLQYPADHIEADNRLSWLLGRLDREYGTEAFYVHLQRDAEAVARSFIARYDSGIMRAYRTTILMRKAGGADPLEVARDYCDTVNSNIEMFLRGKPYQMVFNIEAAASQFPIFWQRIGAQGHLEAALAEFTVRHNSSDPGLFSRLLASLRRRGGNPP